MRTALAALAVAALASASQAAAAAPPPPPPILAVQPITPAAPPSPEAVRLAQRLEELTEPRASFVASNFASWEAAVRRAMSSSPTVAKLEQAYPGVTEAGIAAARPVGRAYCEGFVDKLQARRVALYAGSLSAQDMQQAIAFFQTPAAQRVLHQMLANVDSKPLIEQVARQVKSEGKASVSQEQAAQIDRAALQKTAQQVSTEDQVALMRFGQSAAGRAYAAAHTQGNGYVLELVNAPDPDQVRRQQDAINSGMLAFIDSKKKR